MNEPPKMSYQERLANYEREKMSLQKIIGNGKAYEDALKVLAKKWKI